MHACVLYDRDALSEVPSCSGEDAVIAWSTKGRGASCVVDSDPADLTIRVWFQGAWLILMDFWLAVTKP